jgi:hypothetical protein
MGEEYNSHYDAIKSKLPKNVVQLHENSLHHAKVISFEKPSNDIFDMILDCKGGFHYFSNIKLTFTGVSELKMPKKFEGAWWLYDEVHLHDEHFVLHVLFDYPFSEFLIIAENVIIEQL